MRIRSFSLIISAALLAACAGTPGPGDSGYPYNVAGDYSGTITVQGQAAAGTMQIETASGGAVSGSFAVTQPFQLGGSVAGTLMGDQLTLEIAYGPNPATGCTAGTLSGTLTVTENGSSFAGDITVNDCGNTLTGAMSFSR